jgi:hypothetical protein
MMQFANYSIHCYRWNVVNWDKVSENCAYVVENHAGVPVQG